MRIFYFIFLLLLLGCSADSTSRLDGTWQITSITCNGQPGSPTGAALFISNGWRRYITINGSKATNYFKSDTCTIYIETNINYAQNQMTINFPTSTTCSPAACHAACGIIIATTPTINFKLIGLNKLINTTVQGTDDACTSGGQQDPMVQISERISE
ncbi:MAG: hypothetical protein IPM57_06570 [Oligoflexia bacterium]|nr:hypothetical protein [Oligoflexia bacterium]